MSLERYNPIVIGLIGLFTLFSLNFGFDLVPDIQTSADADQIVLSIPDPEAIRQNARVSGDQFQVLNGNEWTDLTVKGVNIGSAKPGHFPGDAAITYDEYLRWFGQIGEMNANVVRTYSVHPPQFYRALRDHNGMHPESVLFLFQGVYANEVVLGNAKDAFDPSLTRNMRANIESTIDVIHGNLRSNGKPEVPAGNYDTDVSDFVLGLVLGQEWDPSLVMGTDTAFAGMGDFEGALVSTSGGSPFENWLATMLDHAASYGMYRYSHQMPLSFVNYQVLDKLDHPLEPVKCNDIASVDPDHILCNDTYRAGLFATFHAYPYYPDFMNLEYVKKPVGSEGKSSYASYLNDLNVHHSTPILIGEFGLPTSKGLAQRNVDGMDQGAITEEAQGRFLADMFSSMVDEGMMGGIVFSWQDEWFKTTWNVRSALDTEGKPDWYDPINCEENYGLLSFVPGNEQRIIIDGIMDDWNGLGSVQAQNGGVPDMPGMVMTSDEGYLYIMLDLGDHTGKGVRLFLDTLPDHGIDTTGGLTSNGSGMEFMLDVPVSGPTSLFIDGSYEVLNPDGIGKESGFVPFKIITSNEGSVLCSNKNSPSGTYRPGDLIRGTCGQSSAEDAPNDVCSSIDGRFIELRLPWGMLNFRDPSKGIIVGDVLNEGTQASVTIDRIFVNALVLDGQDSYEDGNIIVLNEACHMLDLWDEPTYHERLKGSYNHMKEAFAAE